MRKLLLLSVFSFVCVAFVHAQNVSVKSVSLRQSDLKASTQQRMDANGKACAIVKVGVVGVKDLQFADAVGDVDYSLGEYVVYVPEGLQKLKYRNSDGKISGTVVFDDYGLDVETKRVYSVMLESGNHMRAAIFSVHPVNARLTFNGQPATIDKEGMVIIEKPIGEYSYQVEAPGYISQSGSVKLTEDEIFTTTNIALEQKQYAVSINCRPNDATLFIDNNPLGKLNEVKDLKLPDGEHTVRLTAVGYNDYEQTMVVNGQNASLNVNMVQMEEKVVKHTEERTRTHVNLRPAYYLTLGGELFDKKQYIGHDWGLKLSFGAMQHFAGVFSVYEGISGGLMNLNKDKKAEWFEHPADSANTYFAEVPLLVGISVPFGKFNKHMFSALVGGYGKVMFTEVVDPKSNKSSDSHGNSLKTRFDYGVRGLIIVDISRFTIQAEIGLSLAKFDKYRLSPTGQTVSDGTNNPNVHFGLSLGYKFGNL